MSAFGLGLRVAGNEGGVPLWNVQGGIPWRNCKAMGRWHLGTLGVSGGLGCGGQRLDSMIQ